MVFESSCLVVSFLHWVTCSKRRDYKLKFLNCCGKSKYHFFFVFIVVVFVVQMKLFVKYVIIVEHQIIRDHETNRFGGFGFIIFVTEEVCFLLTIQAVFFVNSCIDQEMVKAAT